MSELKTWIPAVEIENSRGIREVSLRTLHFMNRIIYLTGTIDMDSAMDFASQLRYLENEPDKEISIVINSPGGEVTAGLLIYDLIQGSGLKIHMYCAGMAASMAAVLLAGGQKGRRYILPHSKTMIHEPLIQDQLGGSATSIRNLSNNIMETRDLISSILAKHTGRGVGEINKATSYDHYMNAEESIKFGLCDHIRATIG